MLSRTFEMMSPLRPSALQGGAEAGRAAGAGALVLEDRLREAVDALADRAQDLRRAVDDRLESPSSTASGWCRQPPGFTALVMNIVKARGSS